MTLNQNEFKDSNKRQKELAQYLVGLDTDVDEDFEHGLDRDYRAPNSHDETFMIDIDELIPAPTEWNLWSKLSPVKKIELCMSISEIGLQHNIVAWEIPKKFTSLNGKYMILAGHNRWDAFNELYNRTHDKRFKSIRTLIYSSNSITEKEARKIIDDTNYVGRVPSPQETALAIMRRYTEITESTSPNSEKEVLSIIGDEEDKGYKQVKRYFDLNKLIPEFSELVGSKISIKAGQKLSVFAESIQLSIYEKYYLNESKRHLFTNRTIEKLRQYMSLKTIFEQFENDSLDNYEFIQIEIPSEIKKDVQRLIKRWKKDNGIE